MKRQFLTTLLTLTTTTALYAQVGAPVTDTVSVGMPNNSLSYPNQVWYSLENGVQKIEMRNEWEIAFDLKGFTAGVMINSATGVQLWKYPKNNLANGWSNVDTAGLSTWGDRYNSDTSWSLGAIGRYADPNNSFHLDWGTYNLTTHVVNGDSLYIVKLLNGQFKKFAIESLANGVFDYKYANLDGSNPTSKTLAKLDYPNKNFAYVNLSTQTTLDREPQADQWDLQFSQYTAFVPIPYGVTGVLLNRNTEAVRVSNLPDVLTNVDYTSKTFSTEINTIGYNWKSFNGSGYVMKDSQLFFVRTLQGDVWKLIFKGFGGSTTGNFIFSKQKIYHAPTGLSTVQNRPNFTMMVAPNPAIHTANVLCNFGAQAIEVKLFVFDISGRSVYVHDFGNTSGVQSYQLPISQFPKGDYVVMVHSTAGNITQKFMVQ